MTRLLPALALCLAACASHSPATADGNADVRGGDVRGGDVRSGDAAGASIAKNWQHDIEHTALDVDLASKTASAAIRTALGDARSASFDVKGLTISAVHADGSGDVSFDVTDGRLDVSLPDGGTHTVTVDYAFTQHSNFDGLLAGGSTLVWPYHCGNLFPCKTDPADGLTFELSVHGAPAGATVVYAPSIASPAPPYQIAWATGDYTDTVLGTSKGGTTLHVFSLPGDSASAIDGGTKSLVDVFSWYEQTLGPYPFGADAGAVSVDWGGAAGGMEHHPYWHVGRKSIGDKAVHAHEAAHGWFGDGVRIQCWEDFVLSEGTVTYLAARALAAREGKDTEAAVWASYDIQLQQALAQHDDIVWPKATCNKIDVLKALFTKVPYLKGAHFYLAVEEAVGRPKLDKALRAFYQAYRGKAARMQQMLDTIAAETGFDASALAKTWLESKGMPAGG